MNAYLLNNETRIQTNCSTAECQSSGEAGAIQAAQAGDLEAFNYLVRSYQDRVYRQAYYLLQEQQEAEDITQDVFIIAFQKLNTFRGGSFRAWILRIASNLCLDEIRRRNRRAMMPLEIYNDKGDTIETPSWLTDKSESPETAAERTELRTTLQMGISQLPDRLKEALILVDVQGLKYAEAAQVSNVSIGTIKSRLARARSSLRAYLCSPTQPVSRSYCQLA